MGFSDKAMASVMKKQVADGWAVYTYNLGGVPLQEKFFYSEAEADAYRLQQYALVRAEERR
ncbi:hypothetical protein [Rhizobium redzepovicii]|uniref:hypothetical protein n=1 Tax=Rhizobium redzepovicii TaxID=2867518 RepID=UPI0028718FE9|nr:hypothetical protein [Rhizobium redzepovicii]MDR9783844.1 hypothetical protein [Rhizobium redzepovicii]